MLQALLFWAMSLGTLVVGAGFVCPENRCVVTLFDRTGLTFAHTLRSEILDVWMTGISWIGSLVLLLPLSTLVALDLLRRELHRKAGFLLMSVVGASAISHLAKLAWMRPRPDLFPVWTAMPADWSYPSAHAMQITAAAAAMILLTTRRRALWAFPLGILVLLVGLSRLYLQVHFPSDVIAGILAAVLWVAGLHSMMFDRFPEDGLSKFHEERT